VVEHQPDTGHPSAERAEFGDDFDGVAFASPAIIDIDRY